MVDMGNGRHGLQLVLLVLPVLLGIVGMHALVAPAAAPTMDTGHQVEAEAAMAAHADLRAEVASAPSTPVPATAAHDPMPAEHGEHGTAHLLHLCLAILAAAGLALLAAWLFLGRLTLPASVTPTRRRARGMPAQRPPPVPRRLAQLCVMRT
ncbi:hypothetical protein GCM10009613_06950 [Pseudonocardia kongjuensis]|uniref:Uncharacterized protein n=2 Tax=Pseudonocardia kongjuensis TaxID=102227 RepID=A0ABN1XK92_9PSEU